MELLPSPHADHWRTVGSPVVQDVATVLKPRYHFVSRERLWYQRPPYRNNAVGQPAQPVTRVLSLAHIGVTDKAQKVSFGCGSSASPTRMLTGCLQHLYALNLTPATQMDAGQLLQVPPGVTDNPFDPALLSDSEPALKRQRVDSAGRGLS